MSVDFMCRLEALKVAAENVPEEFYCPECVIEDAKEYLRFLVGAEKTVDEDQ